MMGHKICFNGEKRLIIPKLSLLPLLIWTNVISEAGRVITKGSVRRLNSDRVLSPVMKNEDEIYRHGIKGSLWIAECLAVSLSHIKLTTEFLNLAQLYTFGYLVLSAHVRCSCNCRV